MSDASSSGSGLATLTAEEQEAIDALWNRRMTATHYDLLAVPRNADRKAIRDAYFALSRRFHPDVFFKRDLGAYRPRLDEVFRMLTRAYDVLSNPKQRAGYDLHLANLESRPPPGMPDPPSVEVPRAAPVPAPPAASPTRPVAAAPGDAVVPPPVRSTGVTPAPSVTSTASQPMDPAVRQRAMEAMRRRLNSVMPAAPRQSAPAPAPLPSAPGNAPAARNTEDREAKVQKLLGDGEEAQKRGDFTAALESFRGALQVSKDDPAIKSRVDAVDQLVKTQKTGEYIEKAREAMREGKAEIAATFWEKAWEGRPTDATLLVNAAEVLAKYGNNRGKVKELAQRALAVDPKSAKAHVVLAQVFTAAGLKASARAAVDAVARLEPNNPALKELRDKLGPISLAEQLGLNKR